MSFFDDASLAFLPSGAAGKDGKAYSIKPTDGTGDFTFSRGSNLAATRVGADGLIEKGRENLLVRSNEFDTTWVKSSTTLTSGQTGYDGSSDAWLLTKTASDARIHQNVSFSGVNNFSLYAKAGSLNWIALNNGSSSAWFDLENGATGTLSGGIQSDIQSVGNGWYRCIIIDNLSSGTIVRVYPSQSNGNTSGTSGNILIQSAQLEIGLAATDYIESGATTGKAGLLEDEPRFDYSGGATCPSLLLEPSRTNVIKYSEYAGGTDWVLTNYSVSHNAAISPEGVQNAFQLNIPATNGNARAQIGVTESTEYTFSFYVKRGTATELKYSVFNLNNFSNIIAQTSYYSQTSATEWKRIEVTFTTPVGCTSAGVYIDRDSQGDGTAFFYGVQCEQASYPTSYIPNHSGGSVTRGADDVNKLTGVGVTGDEFTIFLEFDLSDAPLVTNVGTYFQTFDASNNSQQEFRFFSWAGEQVLVPYFRQDFTYAFGNGSDAVRFDGKVLFRADGGGSYTMFFGFNGSSTKEVRTGLTAYTLNKIDFISQPKTNVKQLLIFNEALSDADCTTLTT